MVAVVVIVTPGPDTALTIRNTLLGGRRGGVFTAMGVAAGQATWALATSVGVATLLAASEPVFVAVKLGGAAYLVFLGIQALRGAWRPSGQGPTTPTGGRPPSHRGTTAPSIVRLGGIRGTSVVPGRS